MKFKDFQAPVQLFCFQVGLLSRLEFRRKKFKYFQVLSRMRGNPVTYLFTFIISHFRSTSNDVSAPKAVILSTSDKKYLQELCIHVEIV